MNPEIMKACGFGDMVDLASEGLCPFCQQTVNKSDFRDMNSLNEFHISGLCQQCQDETFGPEDILTQADEWTDGPYRMTCGSAEAEKRRYKLCVGKSGRRWLVAIQDNAADNVYVEGGSNSQGFAGRTLSFTLEDDTVLELKGPWHSDAGSLFKDTGYDVRNYHRTFGVIGTGREYRGKRGCCGPVTITGIIFRDTDWVIGPYDRIPRKAQEIANERNLTVMYFRKSSGGSLCGPVEPKC